MAVYRNRARETAERLIKLRDYLYVNASPTHAIKMADILKYLANEGHEVEIKTVYSDLKTLEAYFGLDLHYDGRQRGYILLNPPFDSYELRSIVNSIQAFKFITQQEADRLTEKIMNLADKYTRPSLKRSTYVPNRVRSINENAMRGLDTIYEAIAQDRKISFKFFNYTKSIKNEREILIVSPYEVTWEDGTFTVYALRKIPEERIFVEYPGYLDTSEIEKIEAMEDSEYDRYVEEMGYIKSEIVPNKYMYEHFFLDIRHMDQVKILTAKREGKDAAERHLTESHRRRERIRLDSSPKTKLKVCNDHLDDIILAFGNDATISPIDDKFSVVAIHQEATSELYMWTREFLPNMEIIFPEDAEDEIRAFLATFSENE